MIHPELRQLHQNPEWEQLLRAYADSQPCEDGWFVRISHCEGIEDERMPRIHGKLIALGLLDFQMTDRSEGLHYQVTPLGRQGLLRSHTPEGSAADQASETAAVAVAPA